MEMKKRHGLVNALLFLMILTSIYFSIKYLFFGETISTDSPQSISQEIFIIRGLISIINVVFFIMLFQGKKLGFWGIVGINIIAFIINLSTGVGILTSLQGIVGIVILYAILQIRKETITAWETLK